MWGAQSAIEAFQKKIGLVWFGWDWFRRFGLVGLVGNVEIVEIG